MRSVLLTALALGALTWTGCGKGGDVGSAPTGDKAPAKQAQGDGADKKDEVVEEAPVTPPKVQKPAEAPAEARVKERPVEKPKKEQPAVAELIAAAKALKPGAIDELAAAGAKAIPAIIAELRRDDRRFSWATAAMAKMGPEAVTPVAALLNDGDHFMRKIAYQTLGQMGATAMPAVPALRRAAQQDRDPRNRGLAASAISQITRR
jgi:hypothetical protein